jgi:excisionase family DNA binding protein
MDRPELLTVSQAAEALNATSQTVRNWIRGERIEAVRIGNRFLIPSTEVERLRGATGAPAGDSPWDTTDQPSEPLPRKTREGNPSADPTEGLIGA